MRVPLICAIGLGLLIIACEQDFPAPEAATQQTHKTYSSPSIPWFAGSVAQAFESAKKQDKPLFLYWGAIWCPPCQHLKSTIFKRHEFIEQIKLFIPVYLDGDTRLAQKWGEQFGVQGYPTVIIFSPGGNEITRIPGGLDIQRYADVLQLTLSKLKPVDQLLQIALDRPQSLSDQEYRFLAYYAWDQDNNRVLEDGQHLSTFKTLSHTTPAHLKKESTRFFFHYLDAETDHHKENETEPRQPFRDSAHKRLMNILENTELVQDNLNSLLYSSVDIIDLVTRPGTPQRESLANTWIEAMRKLGTNTDLSTVDRIYTLLPRIEIFQALHPDQDLPQAFLGEITSTIQHAYQITKDPYQRHVVVNISSHLLTSSGKPKEAESLLLTEIEKSNSPYYFMVELADLAKKAGRTQEAMKWMQKAYLQTDGGATRFQWGYYYLSSLLELSADDNELIEQESLRVLGEWSRLADAGFGRNKRTLTRLEEKLLQWAETDSRRQSLLKIRSNLNPLCDAMPAGDEVRQKCNDLLRTHPTPQG